MATRPITVNRDKAFVDITSQYKLDGPDIGPGEDTVTWLLPVKNGMPYLSETLASIKNQTYANWKVLAWDNGSTDETLEELKKWIPACLPGRVVADRPMGLGASLAEMVKECDTELCARIDADDINRHDRLERQVAFLKAHPEIAAVGAWTDRLDEDGNHLGPMHTYPTKHCEIVHHLLEENAIAHPTVLFRRSAVLDAGNYRDVGTVNIEDYDLWLRMIRHQKLANLPERLLSYRVHDASATQISMAQNLLTEALDRIFCEHAPALYGCREEEAKLLRERRHPSAIGLLWRIASHLASTQGGSVFSHFWSESFVESSRTLVGPRDVFSRLVMASLSRNLMSLPYESARIAKSSLRRAFGLDLQNPFPRPRGSHIHPTVEVTGQHERLDLIRVGARCIIERDVTIWLSSDKGADARLDVGNDVYIGRNTSLGVYQPIHIGNDAQIGAYCYIISANHQFERRDIPIRKQGFTGAPITIEEDAWLGAHAVVLPGVTIGKGAIVGACSVVTKNIPPYQIWAGNPARFIRERS